jgi:putative nucleotidyltransferase with HDIG domain
MDQEILMNQETVVSAYKETIKTYADNENTNKINRLLNNVSYAISEWNSLRHDIKGYPRIVSQNLEKVHDSLSAYRLKMTELRYKATQVDTEIWDLYNEILDEIPFLNKKTRGLPLRFRPRSNLKNLWNGWNVLIAKQEQLLDSLSKAPEALDFYNKMLVMKENHEQARSEQEENLQRIIDATRNAESGLKRYLEELNRIGDFLTRESKVLRLDDAERSIINNLNHFQQIEKIDHRNTDEILRDIYKLNKFMQEAPSKARWIREIEEKYDRLLAVHKALESYGKGILPEQEIARTTVMLYEKVAEFWSRSDDEALDRILSSLEGFISFYEGIGQKELDLAERRRPGFVKTLVNSTMGIKAELSQLVELTRTLVTAIDARDKMMKDHSTKVASLAVQMGSNLNLEPTELNYLEIAALLHDVGKLSIPEHILTKSDPLTLDEWKIIRKHPSYGANILRPVEALDKIIPWVYHHQERWDGTGYPDGLSGDEIPLVASIIGLAEAYSAMKIDLPTRKAKSDTEALAIIKQEAERQFDPQVVEAFEQTINSNVIQ